MGKKNVVTTKYMSVNERFADAINAGVFHGKQIILPSQIEQIDTASNHVLWNREKTKMEVGEQRRDILKTVVYDTNFCIIGIENQSDIHYIFPVRGMLYDALAYKKQWDDIRAEHREEKDLKGPEWLSGFSKEDRIQAVVTLVVYYGTEPWGAAKDIHSLIDWSGLPEELKEVVPNYSIYLLELNKYENPDDFKSDLKTVCRFLQSSNDDKKLEQMLLEHGEEFEDVDEDVYEMIGVLGDMGQLEEVKSKCKKAEGGYDMCKGMDDWLKRMKNEGLELGRSEGLELGRNVGRIEASIETYKEVGLEREDALCKVKEKYSLTEEEVEGYFEMYWK